MVGSVAAALLTALPPNSQRIVGGRVAGCTIVTVNLGEVGVVTKSTIDHDVKVRTGLPVGPSGIIVRAIGKNGHRTATGCRAVVEITVDVFKVAVAGNAGVTLTRKRRDNPCADNQKNRK